MEKPANSDEIESWSSLPVKRDEETDQLVMEIGFDPSVDAVKTKIFLDSLKIRYFCPCPDHAHGEAATPEEREKLSRFIRKHNNMRGGNTSLLPPEQVELLESLDFHRSELSTEGGILVGCIFTGRTSLTYVPDGKDAEKAVVGCTTYLVVHSKFRNVGLGMVLIKQAIKIGVSGEVYAGYHMIGNPVGMNSCRVRTWYRPIDVEASEAAAHPVPRVTKDDARNRRFLAKKYQPYKVEGYNVEPANMDVSSENETSNDETRQALMSFVSQGKLRWEPTLREWRRWTENVNIRALIVRDLSNMKIIGVFVLHHLHLSIPTCREEVKSGWIVFFAAAPKMAVKVFESMVEYARKLDYPYLFLHQMGHLTDEVLEGCKAIRTENKDFLDYYNIGVKVKPEQVFIPIL